MEHPPPADVIALVEHVFERLDAGTGAWRLEFFATDGHVNRDVSILHDILKVAVREELIPAKQLRSSSGTGLRFLPSRLPTTPPQTVTNCHVAASNP